MATPEEIRQFAYVNKYGQAPKQPAQKPKEYALYSGSSIIQSGPYALLVYKKKELEATGARFLKIKPVIKLAKI